MCAIVDANVVHEVFSARRTPAGSKFLEWVEKGKGRIVVGGRLGQELNSVEYFRVWADIALNMGWMNGFPWHEVSRRKARLQKTGGFISNDPDILALAQISGARLLFSNDEKLQKDFRNKRLIDNPRGTVYTTRRSHEFTSTHRRILNKPNLCQVGF